MTLNTFTDDEYYALIGEMPRNKIELLITGIVAAVRAGERHMRDGMKADTT